MKIYYMNDEWSPVTVQVNHQLKPSTTNPYGDINVEYIILKPQESKIFDIDAPEGAIPYVKRWEKRIVLLTYLPVEALESFQRPSDKS